MRVRYSRRALSQLAATHEYLLERSTAAAESVSASLATTIGRLKELPHLGKITDEGEVRVIIEPEYLYRVFYKVENDEVVVIRILHGRQH